MRSYLLLIRTTRRAGEKNCDGYFDPDPVCLVILQYWRQAGVVHIVEVGCIDGLAHFDRNAFPALDEADAATSSA